MQKTRTNATIWKTVKWLQEVEKNIREMGIDEWRRETRNRQKDKNSNETMDLFGSHNRVYIHIKITITFMLSESCVVTNLISINKYQSGRIVFLLLTI